MPNSGGSEMADAISAMPGVAANLLAVHVDDGTGHCRVCTSGGQAPQVWPCSLYGLAKQAIGIPTIPR